MNAAGGFYTGNGHSFFNDINNDLTRVVEANVLGPALVASSRITLTDNNSNIVDVVDYTDSIDPQTGTAKTWQKDDPTTEFGAVDGDHTALDYNTNFDPTPSTPNTWLDTIGGVQEAKHVKDRYFASVAEIACVSSPTVNWNAFIQKMTSPSDGTPYDYLLKVFDKFTIASGFPKADLAVEVDGNAANPPDGGFSIGPPVTSIAPGFTGEQALAYGRININTIIETAQLPVYASIRMLPPIGSMASNMVFPNIQTYLRNNSYFGEPYNGYYEGVGGVAVSQLPIEHFMSISNLLTTKSNVFKIIVVAQAYDRKFAPAAERKLEVIVDRGYNIDPSATGYSQEARDKAKQVRILSYRWITEEE